MPGSESDISARWALSDRLIPAAFPRQGYAPPRTGNDEPRTNQHGSHQCPAQRGSRTAPPVRRGALTARDGFRSRFKGTEPAPSVQQPDVAGRLNSGWSSGTDEQLRSLIANAMRQLPFEHRDVIYRAYYQGWTTARIADDLKITEAAVKSRLHDGLRTLRLTSTG